MPLPKDVRFVSFDCYGTLIDWETGAYEAYQKEADRDGFTIDRNVLMPLFLDIQHEIQGGSYELYAEVLRRTALYSGVVPLLVSPGRDTDEMIANATEAAVQSGMVRPGDRVVVVAGVPVGRPGQTNLLKVETV